MSKSFQDHDHASCVTGALAAADDYCNCEGLQFTKTRRLVLEILLKEHKALGAYEILEHLTKEGFASQPPIVYRALDFLVTNNFAHKIEKLNAYSACLHPGQSHTPIFLICRICKSVAETCTDNGADILKTTAKELDFTVERTVIEAEGTCPNCRDGAIQ